MYYIMSTFCHIQTLNIYINIIHLNCMASGILRKWTRYLLHIPDVNAHTMSMSLWTSDVSLTSASSLSSARDGPYLKCGYF
ncbi:hypothetical protein FKM82_013164 [Ascaphus truei]